MENHYYSKKFHKCAKLSDPIIYAVCGLIYSVICGNYLFIADVSQFILKRTRFISTQKCRLKDVIQLQLMPLEYIALSSGVIRQNVVLLTPSLCDMHVVLYGPPAYASRNLVMPTVCGLFYLQTQN